MGALKFWDGAKWITIPSIAGPQGPAGPAATDSSPRGPAGGGLTGSYPNPSVSRFSAGTLLAVQSQVGEGNTSIPVTNNANLLVDNARTKPLAISYTPPTNCWWDVSLHIGLLQKLDAAYHYGYVKLVIVPNDADGWDQRSAIYSQHNTVQNSSWRTIRHIFRINSGVAYTCYGRIDISAGGSWQYNNTSAFMQLAGKAFAQ